jgi:hypothetical protein
MSSNARSLEVVDVESDTPEELLSLCPICDCALEEPEPLVLIRSGGALGLAHQMCLDDLILDQQEGEDEEDAEAES